MNFLIELFIRTFIETFYLAGAIILIGMILGILRNYSIKNFQRSFGSKSVMITGFIGVPVHELSHAIFAILFGHKVTDIKLLQKPDENGIMGYVNHSYNQRSIYQQIGNFFIGVAPIFGGVISIIALMRFIIPQAYNSLISILVKSLHITVLNRVTIEGIVNSYAELIKTIFSLKNFQNPYFFIFLFVAICISSHISLSSADIKGASRGLGILFLILLILNTFGLSKYILAFNIIKYNILITGFLIIAVILSVITFLLSLILLIIREKGMQSFKD
jgi:hypothetical protein